ncbi:glycosyltransferase [Aliarcobacter cryaerophilus]|uniref:glycosyltransferase n=1 Tax=Aliarcobacter cryaerophilus TaxID=28198 RepID=UPI0021B69AE6|nr:glycosyltransferase [Aliarcobacter cryaerophilus]MCT7517015.1 glycosyltransferase [Aliarcobacter cryaerophilus]
MKKINILQLVTGLGMGGAEKVVLDLAKYISNEEFNITVVAMSKRDELYQEFLNNKIDTRLLKKSNSIKNIFYIINTINKLVKEKNIQIIHAHMTHSIIIASILKVTNPSLKIIFTSHNLNIGSKLRECIVWILKPLRNIDIVFSKDILKYFYKSRYKVIPNGIKVDKYDLNLSKNNKFTFVAIGRLETVKNHKFLIEIANELKDKFEFEIHIVGNGYLKEELENLIQKYDLKEYVKLLGLRNDIPELLNQSYCLLMPSLWEGLPIVILEAGASRLPIISTPVGSIPSLLNDTNSYLVNLEKFKDKMVDVINNYEEAIKKGEKLFEEIKNSYSIENIVNKHEKIYKELI